MDVTGSGGGVLRSEKESARAVPEVGWLWNFNARCSCAGPGTLETPMSTCCPAQWHILMVAA